MDAEALCKLLVEADRAQRYVWLKHRFDPTPRMSSYSFNEDGSIYVALYHSFDDTHEGVMKITSEEVEWAQISGQVYLPVLRERVVNSLSSGTLVRVTFCDFLGEQAFHCTSQEEAEEGGVGCFPEADHSSSFVYGHFVQTDSLSSDPVCSRIPLHQLLDIENTEISSESVKPLEDFMDGCCNPNLRFYHASQQKP